MAKKRGTQQGNNPNPNPPPDDDDDDGDGGGLSDGQRNEIIGIVNAAVSGQLGRKLKGTLSGLLDEALAPMREQMEQLGSGGSRRRRDDDDTDDDLDDDDDDRQPQRGKGKGKGGKQRSADPELDTMKKKLKALEDERKQEREQTIARERDAMVREHLTKLGVDPNRLRGAAAVVRESLKRDEKTGEWSFIAKRDGYDDPIDVAEGLKEWAATDEGKSYLAPQNGQQPPRGGSGFRPGQNGGTGAGGPVLGGGRPTNDPKAAKQQAKQQAMQTLSSAIDQLGGANIPLS